MPAVQVDALKQKVKPTPVVVTPVQTPPVPAQVSGLPVDAPPPPVSATPRWLSLRMEAVHEGALLMQPLPTLPRCLPSMQSISMPAIIPQGILYP